MMVLPIIERELRVAARGRRLYVGRVTTGLAALGLCFYLMWLARAALGGAAAGAFILKALSYLAWAICIFGGMNRTYDCLSAEKRGDTLGLLLLTRLKAKDVVLGKLFVNGFSAFLLLLGVVPILSIPLLLGGVGGAEVVRIPIALFNSLFLSLSIGLLVSSLVRSQRAATSLSGGMIVSLALVFPALALLLEREWRQPFLARIFRAVSPFWLQEMAFTNAVGLSTNDFWKSILCQFMLGLSALAGACLILPFRWRSAASGIGWFARWREKLKGRSGNHTAARDRRRAKLLARNPWFWRCSRDRFAALSLWVFAIVMIGATLAGIIHYDVPTAPACGLLFGAMLAIDLVIRARIASLASSRLAEDRQSGALEMILSSPLSVPEIVQGQWMAIRRVCLKMYLVFLLVSVLGALVFIKVLESPAGDRWILCVFVVISVMDFIVLGYVGMWRGLTVSHPRQAAGKTLLRVTIVPWLIWAVCFPVIQRIGWLRQIFDENQPYRYLLLGFTIWAISAALALRNARRNLSRHFREAATDRYSLEERFDWFRPFSRRNARSILNTDAPCPSKNMKRALNRFA